MNKDEVPLARKTWRTAVRETFMVSEERAQSEREESLMEAESKPSFRVKVSSDVLCVWNTKGLLSFHFVTQTFLVSTVYPRGVVCGAEAHSLSTQYPS